MKTLLGPFLESFPFWRRRPWLLGLLLLLAPVAFLAGRRVQTESGQSSLYEFEGYEQIVRRARETAKSLSIPASEWTATIRFSSNAEMNRFAQRERARMPPEVRRVLPAALVRVLLLEGAGKWVEFTYSAEGHLVGYQASPGLFVSEEMLAQAGTRVLAECALEAVADPKAFEFGAPSMKTSDGGMAQRFEWNLKAKCCPELATTAVVEVVGSRASYVSVSTSFQSFYMRRLNTPLNLLAEALRVGFMICAMVFVGFRFARRAMEREVPYKRAAVAWAVLTAVGVIFVALQPFGAVSGDPIFIAGPIRYAGVLVTILVYLVLGLLLALAYGATEGDLRERLPGRLTSFDTLLSGRLLSKNVGVSLVAGAAWGAWVYGATQVARAWLAPDFIPLNEILLRYSYTAAPWLGLLCANLSRAAETAVAVPLVVLSMGGWLGRTRRQSILVTVLATLGAVAVPGSPFADAHTAVLAAGSLVALWLGLAGLDFLAAVASLMLLTAGSALVDLEAVMPAWRQPAAVAFLAGGATLIAALVAVYGGRRYEDAEVIPDYARNIEERQSRQQEVSAAREAQSRLLPERPPDVAGLGLAAFCAPSNQGVSGDFFDFYPMSRGRLGLLVADGRTGGLDAALTIALAKGFVQYAAHRDWPAGETLRRLRDVWGGTSGELNVTYAIIDPAHRQVRFARLGATPVLLAGRDELDRTEPLSGPISDGLTEGTASFAHGDVLLVYTDGVPQRLAVNRGDGLDMWLRNRLRLTSGVTAYRIGESLQEALRVQEGNAPDDLTAVVIRFEAAAQATVGVGA